MKTISILQLGILLWFGALLVAAHIVVLARCVLWPRLRRILHCAWCWQDCGIGGEYPPPWSSTMCPYHRRLMQEQLAARRHARRPRDAAEPMQEREAVQV
jgi:hypothetical protein